MKILTTYFIPQNNKWQEATLFIDRHPKHFKLVRSVFKKIDVQDWWLPFRLLLLRDKFDVLFTGAEREDTIFAFLQLICPGKKIPQIYTCCLWKRESNPLLKVVKKMILRALSRSVSLFVVWSTAEIENYHREFGIPRNKLVFLPHHSSTDGYNFISINGEYAFAGGNSSRDYKTLIEAARGISIKVIIALTDYSLIKGVNIPSNIEIKTLSAEEFRQYMAGACFVVVPMQKGILQGAGQQTYLNAMMLKKPVIISDVPGVKDYVEDGKTGLIVPAGDIAALRGAINTILSNNGAVTKIAEQAYLRVSTEFTLDRFVERNLSLILSVGARDKSHD